MAPTTAKKRKPQARAEDSAAFGPIAERFRRAGDLDRAVSLCREGLQKFPDHISARVTLGWALLDLGNFNEARIELELVLRRAPDNLSAIRGLAELHDRSEHTMDLPMDGPGQWPPAPETVEKLNNTATAVAAAAAANGDIVDEAVWAPAAGGSEPHEPDSALRQEQTVPDAIKPGEQGAAMWSAVTEVEPEISPLVTRAGGMSSMREIDPNAGAVSFEATAPAESALTAPDPIAALEADLQALIAEADTLEAAADASSVSRLDSEEPAIVLDAAVDLSAFEDATAELTAGIDAVVEPETFKPSSELEALIASAEPEALPASIEAVAAAEAQALTAAAEPEALFASAEPEAIAARVEAEPELVDAPAEELTSAVDHTPSFELTPWDETMAVYTDEVEAAGAMAESPSDELTLAFDFETVPAPAAAETAEVVSFAPVAATVQVRSPLPALERFLGRVQRRRVLVAESVA